MNQKYEYETPSDHASTHSHNEPHSPISTNLAPQEGTNNNLENKEKQKGVLGCICNVIDDIRNRLKSCCKCFHSIVRIKSELVKEEGDKANEADSTRRKFEVDVKFTKCKQCGGEGTVGKKSDGDPISCDVCRASGLVPENEGGMNFAFWSHHHS